MCSRSPGVCESICSSFHADIPLFTSTSSCDIPRAVHSSHSGCSQRHQAHHLSTAPPGTPPQHSATRHTTSAQRHQAHHLSTAPAASRLSTRAIPCRALCRSAILLAAGRHACALVARGLLPSGWRGHTTFSAPLPGARCTHLAPDRIV
jgi:hypothetical protein